jgi:uncharacterized protein YggU (UPF0235/DUF167 family)
VTHIAVRVTPRSARDEAVSWADGVLSVRVTAPPADGAANAAVARLLARALDLPGRDVVLIAGATARLKRFEVALEPDELGRRLARAIAGNR